MSKTQSIQTKTGRRAPRFVMPIYRAALSSELNRRNLAKTGLIPDSQTIRPEAAIGPLAGAIGRAITGGVPLRLLDCANQVCLLHIDRIDTEIFGLFLYPRHCNWSCNCLYQTHIFLLLL
jgi:hypothetical protein